MRPLAGWSPANRAALALFLASCALCAAKTVEARRLDPLPTATRAGASRSMPRVASRGGKGSEVAVLAAVARDPFRADRRRAPGRLATAGMLPSVPSYVPPPVPSVAAGFRLLGTVVIPGGGLAVVAGAAGEGRVMRVGQEMAGYRLVRVGPGTATLTGEDTTVVLRTAGGAQ